VFNHTRSSDLPQRVGMSLLAVVVMYAIALGAYRLGIGRLWGGWIGVGLLTGGVLSNGVSYLIWNGGVPDFIRPGGDFIWNVADFAIGIGLTGGMIAIAATAAIAFVRERLVARIA
jgi:lipoprotein signal peptidase